MSLTVRDKRVLVSLARYGVMSWQQVCRWFYGGNASWTAKRVTAMVEAGLVQQAHELWPGSVLWCTRVGNAAVAELSNVVTIRQPSTGSGTERLLHRLAVVDVGLNIESTRTVTVLTEREVRAAEQGPNADAAVVAARLGLKVQPVRDGRNRQRWFVVPDPMSETGAVHYPDLIMVRDGRMQAVEVEVSVKPSPRAVGLLRAYSWSRLFDKVVYFATGDVQVNLTGYWADSGRDYRPGWLHEAGLLNDGPPEQTPNPYMLVHPLDPDDEAVAWQLDMRQVPQDWWVSKREWTRLRAQWREHPSARLPGQQRVPFLKWWLQTYPQLRKVGEVA